LSSHPPFRLRLTLAFLVLAVAATTVGAAVLLGSNQAAPTTIEVADVGLTGPPVVGGIDFNPAAAETAGSGMRLGVLDKDAALEDQRQAAQARDAAAFAAYLEAQAQAEAEAIADYAAALDAAQASDDAPAPVYVPPPSDGGGGGGDGGGGGGGGGGSLYEKLDNIATCESNQNPRAYNPEGPWYGAFQFRFDTWQSYGGGGNRGQDIFDYSYEQQREIAANLALARGFAGSWPTCAARYGYT